MITPRERTEIETANRLGKPPVVFVHGLWMLASSWRPWIAKFHNLGYVTVAVDWPDDPDTVQQGRADGKRFARKRIHDVTDHVAEVIEQLAIQPATVGHSFGGLIVQQIAGRGLAAATAAIDAAPFRGVLPLPISSLRSAAPVLRNPVNYQRSVTLSERQFRYSFTNALDQAESDQLFAEHPVPGSGRPLFQAATANINPFTQAKVDTTNPQRGPLLMVSGSNDHIAPPAIAKASYKRQRRNRHAATEYVEVEGRGHSLVFDSGWETVADHVAAFFNTHHPSPAVHS